jgi:hypothetical protein
VLSRFEAGGTGLVLLWWSFAMTAVPFGLLVVLLSQAIVDPDQTLLAPATTVGGIAAIVQFLGWIGWPFLVPYLARAAPAPDATPARLEAVDVVFQSLDRYLGVAVGEHLGYAWVEGGDGKCIPGNSSARLRARVGSAASQAPMSSTPRLTGQRWYRSSASRDETSSRP